MTYTALCRATTFLYFSDSSFSTLQTTNFTEICGFFSKWVEKENCLLLPRLFPFFMIFTEAFFVKVVQEL